MSTTVRSSRLRPGVALYAAGHGHVLRVDDAHHRVHLAPADAEALLDALVLGGEPAAPPARAALASLVDAGLADPAPGHHSVVGDGALATAVRGALTRMGATVGPGGEPVTALDDVEDPADLPVAGRACWLVDHLVVLAPPAVPARDVAARRWAATRHRNTDPVTSPRPGARSVAGAPSAAGLELGAVVVAAELLRGETAAPYEAVVVDLVTLTATRRPVLPLPAPPR